MQTNFNENHIWGGQYIQPFSTGSSTSNNGGDKTTIVGPQQDSHYCPLSQAGFIASNSDDLFHPTSGGPVSYVFNLPDIPLNPNPQYHIIDEQILFLVIFLVLLLHHIIIHHFFHQASYNLPRGPPPPIPPRNPSQPMHNQFQQFFPAYNHPFLPEVVNQLSSTQFHVPTSFKTLPTVIHIPILTSKLDFFAWDEGVTSLIQANGLIGHILDPLESVDPSRPDRMPALMPILPIPASSQDIANLTRWWDDDNIAQHILVSRLGTIP